MSAYIQFGLTDILANMSLVLFFTAVLTVDSLACMVTTQLPRYNSRFMNPLSKGIDGLSQQNWGFENNYVNPPFRMIGKVLDVIIAQQAVATIVALHWPDIPWFQRLQRILIDQAICI